MNEFDQKIKQNKPCGLYAEGIDVLQVNVGLRCNLACRHCHLACSPTRSEVMPWSVMEKILAVIDEIQPRLIDITGGAPELNPELPRFLKALRSRDCSIQVRTNLVVLLEPGMEAFFQFYRDNQIHLIASMPCYLEENVEAQRGRGVYPKSIEAIRRLNTLGYGSESNLHLDLVYNPGGAFLPGEQGALEEDYKRELHERFGVVFSRLLTIANMPIGRFQAKLQREAQEEAYLQLLKEAFNPQTIRDLMCRHQISIGWDGTLYDCDFNLALGAAINHGAPNQIQHFDPHALSSRRIVTGTHCFGCTAGCGSSCAGALL